MSAEPLSDRHRSASGLWKTTTESGVVVHPLEASVAALENLGCDMGEAHGLLVRAAKQYETKQFDRLLVTIALLNCRMAEAIERIRVEEPTTWGEYRRTLPASLPTCDGKMDRATYVDRTKGAWLGKCIGTALGGPVEGWTREAIESAYGWIDRYVLAPRTENDDTAYPILVLHALDEHGIRYTSEQLALEWVEHLPFAYTAEQAALENLRAGVMPPESRWRGNPCGAWVGGQMRGEVHGLVAPLSPAVAAEFAFRDAVISHYCEGLHGEIYVAVLISMAFADLPTETLLRRALAFVPEHSRLRETVERTIGWCRREGDWRAVAKRIEQELGQYHWIHALPNLACAICGLLLGEGDFERSLLTTLACGHDTDCSVGQVGALLGATLGASRLPEKWTEPIGEALDTYVIGHERVEFDGLSERTARWGEKIAGGRVSPRGSTPSRRSRGEGGQVV